MAKSKSSKKPASTKEKAAKKTPSEELLDVATALPAAAVQRRRFSGMQFVFWLRTLAATAIEDHAHLLRVSMDPEPELTKTELESLALLAGLITKQYEQLAAQQVALAIENDRNTTLAAGRAAQREVMAALQHLYRADTAARKVLAEIRRGEGELDFLQDVPKLEALIEQRKDVFDRLIADAPNARKEMNDAAATLAVPADETATRKAATLRELRNRMLALAELRAKRICSAGRYAFRNDPAKRKAYRTFRSTRKAQASKKH